MAAVVSDLLGPKLGTPAPKYRGSEDHLAMTSSLIEEIVWREYQKVVAKKVRVGIDSSDDPLLACLKGQNLVPVKMLGKGSYGAVWLTSDKNTVVKIGNVSLEPDPPTSRNFDRVQREFQISRAAGELGVSPKIFDAFLCCANDGSCFYVIIMEFVPGVDLHTWNKKASTQQKQAMRQKLLRHTAALADAGIEHLDLHDGNVLVRDADDEPVIVDFGLASWARLRSTEDDDQVNRIFSRTESMSETVRYVAKCLLVKGVIKFH